jgi:hypothetical protein
LGSTASAAWRGSPAAARRRTTGYLATARPRDLGHETLADRSVAATEPAPGREDALELALLMADEDARAGDLRQALHALDAALALSGGVLPPRYAERRARWQDELKAA